MGIRIEHTKAVVKETGPSGIEEFLKRDIKLFGGGVNSKKKELFTPNFRPSWKPAYNSEMP
ncbi:hypothetical protein [Aureicoccus marinus]|uniref:hypothetical protein n=1 Tax=Aureicoccus marinus TaxID=754435 RepID=UPI000CF415AB|nr:hypothetical protein [Aureicoccus marinus]